MKEHSKDKILALSMTENSIFLNFFPNHTVKKINKKINKKTNYFSLQK